MKPEFVMPLLAAGVGIVGTLLGVIVSDYLARRRETRDRNAERRLLAGALAAELRGFLGLWKRVAAEPEATWSVEGDYFPVYNLAGHRLSLLKRDVVQEVVTCYSAVKGALDMLRRSQRLRDHEGTRSNHGTDLTKLLTNAHEEARSAGSSAELAVDALLPKLDTLAGGGAQ